MQQQGGAGTSTGGATTGHGNESLSQIASGTQLTTDLTNIGNVITQPQDQSGQPGLGFGQDTNHPIAGGALGPLDTGKPQHPLTHNPVKPPE